MKEQDPTQEPSVLPPPERKAVYVRTMFAQIAAKYDLMNRLMTLGRDRAWRRYTVSQALGPISAGSAPQERQRVLDMACGTGDLAFEVLKQQPHAQAVGLDFTPEMLVLAQQKAAATQIAVDLVAGDALKLPFLDGEFDAIVTAFALRNVVDIPATFLEMARVTRPGGRVASLEIAKPRLPLFRRLFALYFYRFVPMVGGWVTGQRSAYTYLPHSLTAFLTPEEIAEVMRQTGWEAVSYRRMMFGTVAVHVGTRGS